MADTGVRPPGVTPEGFRGPSDPLRLGQMFSEAFPVPSVTTETTGGPRQPLRSPERSPEGTGIPRLGL